MASNRKTTDNGRPERPAENSELAQFIARLAHALPARTADDLRRLLARRLTLTSTYDLREARLGLLIELVSELEGVVPTTADYERERERRVQFGETWPAHSTLITAYRSWRRAVTAAMWLARDGQSARVDSSNHHHIRRPRYTRDEALAAIVACRDALFADEPDTWPTRWEYDDYRRLVYELARDAGSSDPRAPGHTPLGRLFGGWRQALAAAKRARARKKL